MALHSLPAQAPEANKPVEHELPMAVDATPEFLVATIKPSDPAATSGWAFPIEGHHIACTNATLETIVQVAYGIHAKQIVDGPAWFGKDRYDINGVPNVPGVPNLRQIQEMYKKLLADRFHLSLHRDTRDIPIYALTVAKGGPLLKVADASEQLNAGNSGNGSERTMKFTNMSMSDFALNMNLYEDRPVIDQTSLKGGYDFTLSWTFDVARQGEPGAPPSLSTAIKEQLGLRLDAVKGRAEVLVIDHVDRPTDN